MQILDNLFECDFYSYKLSFHTDWKGNYDDYDDGGDDLNFDYSDDKGYYDEDYFD